jgi:hypothetical protein
MDVLAQQINAGAVRSDRQNGFRHPIHLVAIAIRVLQAIPRMSRRRRRGATDSCSVYDACVLTRRKPGIGDIVRRPMNPSFDDELRS